MPYKTPQSHTTNFIMPHLLYDKNYLLVLENHLDICQHHIGWCLVEGPQLHVNITI